MAKQKAKFTPAPGSPIARMAVQTATETLREGSRRFRNIAFASAALAAACALGASVGAPAAAAALAISGIAATAGVLAHLTHQHAKARGPFPEGPQAKPQTKPKSESRTGAEE